MSLTSGGGWEILSPNGSHALAQANGNSKPNLIAGAV